MLHPVGKLPAAVYWRRRMLVLTLLVAVLGGGGWLAVAAVGRWSGHGAGQGAPRLASEQSPTGATTAGARPCTDEMLAVSVRAPAGLAAGSTPTFELVVVNTSTAPCSRALDKGQQEVVLLDAAGHRFWSSDDCVTETGTDTRTLAPGQSVSFPVVWSGMSSEPTCTATPAKLPAGQYLVRGRLGTKVASDVPLPLS